ncbi:MAG: hypothetical protein JWP89_2346 [Schlesneria sp.]|nr:hypothetical protein [Schlesneria sp.]
MEANRHHTPLPGLLDASERELYDINQLRPIQEATRDGHLEFLLRFHGSEGLPESSRN